MRRPARYHLASDRWMRALRDGSLRQATSPPKLLVFKDFRRMVPEQRRAIAVR
jgi:hypothetical protein